MRRVHRKTDPSPSLSTLARQEIVAAKRGQRPQIPDDTDWSLRRAPPDDEFEHRKQRIYGNGLLCKVQLWTAGNNLYPENPLIGLKVTPLEQPITNAPALHTKVWHISVAFKDPRNAPLEKAFAKKYKEPRVLRLWFSRIGHNAVSELHYRDPIASDPVVQALHQASHYKNRPLHITF